MQTTNATQGQATQAGAGYKVSKACSRGECRGLAEHRQVLSELSSPDAIHLLARFTSLPVDFCCYIWIVRYGSTSSPHNLTFKFSIDATLLKLSGQTLNPGFYPEKLRLI